MLVQKGKNKFTYYVPSSILFALISGDKVSLSAPPAELNTQPQSLSALPSFKIPEEIVSKINLLGKRTSDVETIKSIIVDLCALKALQGKEIASILGKSDRYIFRKFLKPLLEEKRLEYTVPDMINHPEQAYKTIKDKLIK